MENFQKDGESKSKSPKVFNEFKFKQILESINDEEEFYKKVNNFLNSLNFEGEYPSSDEPNKEYL